MMRMKTCFAQRRGERSSPAVTTSAIIGRARSGGIGNRLGGRGRRIPALVPVPRKTTMMTSSLGLLCCAAAGGTRIAQAYSSQLSTVSFANNPRLFVRPTMIAQQPPSDGTHRRGFLATDYDRQGRGQRRGVAAGFASSRPAVVGGGVFSVTAKPSTISATPATTRMFGSLFNDPDPNNNRNKKDNRNILTKAVDAAKDVGSKILPSVFGTPEERERTVELERRRRETRDEVSGGLSSLLKDAPLPIRMMGRAIAPLLTTVAEGFREQAREVEEVLDDARVLLVSDPIARDMLGEPITVGSPFSQSSSSMSVNGVTRSRVEASFEVVGSRSAGVATVTSSSGEDGVSRIEGLRLNVGGRSISVDVSGGGSSGGGGRWIDVDATTGGGGRGPSSSAGAGRGNIIDADVIDAEYVDKKQKPPRW